ncbi:COG3637 Opacity protein and related surface antigens [Methylophilaceae bacterium]
MKKTILWALLVPSMASYAVLANAESEPTSLVPNAGAYLGFGFNAHSTRFNDQDVTATGTSVVTNSTTHAAVSSGTAGGPAVGIDLNTVNAYAPSIQAGYFEKWQNSNYLWGSKFTYSYLGGSTATNDFIRIPQYGAYANGTPFTGNAIASSYQKTIKHQMSLIPYLGQAFERSTVYLGAGPTLSQVNTKINNLVGFADLNGVRTDISGVAQNFSDTQWVIGATAMLGGSYYLNNTLFLDINYSYSMTKNKTSNYYSTFHNVSSPNTYDGELIGSSTGTATVQSIGISINKLF